MKTLKLVGVLLLAAACGKKADDKKAEPAPTPKVVEQKPKEAPAMARVAVTSKSPDAIAAIEKARWLTINARGAEAVELYKKAISLDPELAVAHAELGLIVPGSEGTDSLAKAGTLAAKVTEGEQKIVEAYQAMRGGDTPKAVAALQKVTELAPGQWEIHLQLANLANQAGDHVGAIKHAEMALAAKADLATAHNALAYAHAGQHEWDKAIAEAKKQTEMMPKEPNPQDTLGEVQLWAGKFEDAEKSFTAATTIEPKFTGAWQGVALSRAYRGDFKGAIEANAKRADSVALGEKFEMMIDAAWYAYADGNVPTALAAIASVEKDPAANKLPIYAFAAIDRARMLEASGKYADAAKSYAEALKRAESLAGDAKAGVQFSYRLGMLRTAALAGKPVADADKLVAGIEEDAKAKANAADKPRQSLVSYAKGLQVWAKSGAKDAIAELAKCDAEMILCRFDLAAAQRKTGDTAGAEATEKSIRETPRRDVMITALWTKLPKK